MPHGLGKRPRLGERSQRLIFEALNSLVRSAVVMTVLVMSFIRKAPGAIHSHIFTIGLVEAIMMVVVLVAQVDR